MDMEQLKKNLEEALEQIDQLIEERDNLKDRYEDAKVYIGKLKDKIDDLKATKVPSKKTSGNDEIEDLETMYNNDLSLKFEYAHLSELNLVNYMLYEV